ncbi:hypothetical protein JCM10213_008914 [Rhodosporidiobolus nylandii]
MFSLFGQRYAGVSKPDVSCDKATLPSSDPTAVVGEGAKVNEAGEGKVFDYVICGGGTAGCVLASRLTEDPTVTVLLIEAGESDQKQLFSKVPAGWPNLWKTSADWDLSTTPQAQLNNRELYQPRGKMLGGCSAINAQIYQHCSPEDYDLWVERGATGWGYSDLKPYFAKAEGFTPHPEDTVDESLRNKDGVWKISYPPTNETTKAFIQSGPKVGIPHNPDLNVETNTSGITRFQTILDAHGQRSSTSAAYLTPSVFRRKNLSILTSTTCTRLLISPTSDTEGKLRIEGVELAQSSGSDSQRWIAKARREVILAQGTYGTPQLLLCSGIGGKETLDKAGVEQKLDLPGVGQALKEHLVTPVAFNVKKGTSLEWMKRPIMTLPALLRWQLFGTGSLTTNLAEGGAFLRSEDVDRDGRVIPGKAEGVVPLGETNSSGPESADLELIAAPAYFQHHALVSPPEPTGDYGMLAPVMIRPFSTGSVSVQSGDVFDKPLIDMGAFADERDMKVILAGLHLVQRLSQTSPFKDFLLAVCEPSLSLSEFAEASDEQLIEHIREHTETLYHPTGTCKIGTLENGGVVDPSLRVHGISNLRICDASVFPETLSGHPQAAVVAVAEKFADMLKAELAA